MKKALYIFVILSNLILFSFLYSVYQEKDISDAYNLYGYKEGKAQFTIIFTNEMKDQYNQEFVTFMNTLSKQKNVTIYNEISSYTKGISYYISSEQSFQELTGIVDEKPITFFSKSNSFYSNQHKKDKHHFYTLQKNFYIEFHPFAQVIDDAIPNGNFTVLCDTEEIANDIKYEFQEKYGNYIDEIVVMQQDRLQVDEAVKDKLQIVYIMSFMIVIMLLLLLLESNLHKIGIMKLHGYSSVAIFKKIFLRTLMYCMGLSVLTCICMFIFNVGIINHITMTFIKALNKALLFENLLLLLIVCFLFVVCIFISSAQLLKKRNQLQTMLSLNYILKLVCVMITLPIFLTHWTDFCKQYDVYRRYENNKQELSSYSWFSKLKNGYQNDGYNLSNYMMNKYDDVYARYQSDYEQINKHGAMYYSINDIVIDQNETIPCVFVNENYIRTVNLKDIKGKYIKMSSTSHMDILVPQQYSGFDIKQQILNNGNEVAVRIIADNQNFSDLALLKGFVTAKNPVFVVFGDDALRIDKSIFNDVYYKGNISKIMTTLSVNDIVEVAYGKNEIKDMQEYRIPFIKDNVAMFLLMLIMMGALSVEYCYFYFKINANKIGIRILHGHKMISIYKYVMIGCISVYIPSILIMIKNQMLSVSVFVIILMDMVVHIGFIYCHHRNRLSRLLKGE